MQQFNEQFMTRYLLPLLGEVITDMGKGEKNLYLRKLTAGQTLDPKEKEEFVRYYFENRQDPNRKKPFADTTLEQDRQFWNKFSDEFGKFMILRYRLSGTEGAQQAFSPDKEGKFNAEVSRNVYDLAYRITLDFEQERIKQLIDKETDASKREKDSELLKKGLLKLVVVNGVERYISEEEAHAAAASKDPAVKDLKVQPGMMGAGKVKPEDAKTALEAGSAIAKEGEKPAAAQPLPTGSATFADLQPDFDASKKAGQDATHENIVTTLAENGMQIVPNSFLNPQGQWNVNDQGMLEGRVKDRKGQELKVKINPKLGAKDPKKFEFAFVEGKAPNGQPLDGLTFTRSEENLNDFKQKDAFEVAQPELPGVVKEKAPKPLPVEKPPIVPVSPKPIIGAPTFAGAPSPIEGVTPLELKGKAERKAPAIPKSALLKMPAAMPPAGGEAAVEIGAPAAPAFGALPKPLAPLPTSVMEKKQAVAARPAVGPRPPFMTVPRVPASAPIATAPAGEKTKNPMVTFAKWATIGSAGSMIAASGAYGIWANVNPEQANPPLAFILKCLASICLS